MARKQFPIHKEERHYAEDTFCPEDNCLCDIKNILLAINENLSDIHTELQWLTVGGRVKYMNERNNFDITCDQCGKKEEWCDVMYQEGGAPEFLSGTKFCGSCEEKKNEIRRKTQST